MDDKEYVNVLFWHTLDDAVAYHKLADQENSDHDKELILMPDNNYYLLLNEIKNLQGGDSEQINLYTVFDIHDYLCTLLAAINSGDLEQKIITCRNCGKSFISSNQKAIYCSSACRNRANVKKSYYRKKSRIDM